MEEILKFFLICLLFFGIGWFVGRITQPKTPEPQTIHTETILHDTITQIEEKAVQLVRFDTVLLPVFLSDTITDTLETEIPISQFVFDTAGCRAVVSGFGVRLDTLRVETKIITDTIIVPAKRKWHFGLGFAIGFGYVR